jgi:hypothetical protein
MLPQAATDFYALQQRVSKATRSQARRAWRRVGDDFDGGWRRAAPTILSALAEAQSQVVLAADEYVPNLLAQVDLPDQPVGRLWPQSLVGVASDQRPLESLAYGAVTTAKEAVASGASPAAARNQGGDWLDLMTQLQVADAARQAVGVLMGSRPNLGGYVRVLTPPSCQRCAILAGRFYRWSSGFQRHPRCDCVNLPSSDAGWAKSEGFLTDPMDAFRNGDIRDLTRAQTKAINDGADISRVVNARRGMSTTARAKRVSDLRRPGTVGPGQPDLLGMLSGLPRATTSGASAVRVTPEDIYRMAADRTEAIALLRRNGYIT